MRKILKELEEKRRPPISISSIAIKPYMDGLKDFKGFMEAIEQEDPTTITIVIRSERHPYIHYRLCEIIRARDILTTVVEKC